MYFFVIPTPTEIIPIPIPIPMEMCFSFPFSRESHGNPIPTGNPIPMHTSKWVFKQESCAIAKTTVRCALYIVTLKIFHSP